jgi:hypothetical protein
MRYTGHVKNGVVVFDGPTCPPDGTVVQVENMSAVAAEPAWGEVLKDLIGSLDGLPKDMAENHDHYIHSATKNGTSK